MFDVSHINFLFHFVSFSMFKGGGREGLSIESKKRQKNRKIVAYDSVFFDFYGLGVVFLVSLGAKVDSPPDLSHVGGRRTILKRRSWSVVRQCLFPVSQDARRPVPTTTTPTPPAASSELYREARHKMGVRLFNSTLTDTRRPFV